MKEELVVAVVVAALCVYECQNGVRAAVGDGCKKDGDCMPGTQCTEQQCRCRGGYNYFSDFSKCVNVSQQLITTIRCTVKANCSTVVEGSSHCLVLTKKSSFCVCDPGSRLHHSNTSCVFPCLNNTFCAQHSPFTVCVENEGAQKEGYNMSCKLVQCQSDNNCTGIPGTKCLAAGSRPDLKLCQHQNQTHQDDDKGSGPDEQNDEKTQLEKNFTMYMEIAFCIVGVAALMTVTCVVLVLSGTCSGDPLRKTAVHGRGVPMFRKHFGGGGNAGIIVARPPPQPMLRTLSTSTAPSIRTLSTAPRIRTLSTAPSISIARPTASVVGSSVSSFCPSMSVASGLSVDPSTISMSAVESSVASFAPVRPSYVYT